MVVQCWQARGCSVFSMNETFSQNGWAKHNVDAAVFASSGRIGVCAVIGDHNGQFTVALKRYMYHTLSLSHRVIWCKEDWTCIPMFPWCKSWRSDSTMIWGISKDWRWRSKLQHHFQITAYKSDLAWSWCRRQDGNPLTALLHRGSTCLYWMQQLPRVSGKSVDCVPSSLLKMICLLLRAIIDRDPVYYFFHICCCHYICT